MYNIFINNKTYNLSNEQFLSLIMNLAKGYSVLANAYSNYHLSGFADLKNTFIIKDVGQYEINKELIKQIEDPELSKYIHVLEDALENLQLLDNEIKLWLAHFVCIKDLRTKKDITRLDHRLQKIITSGPDGTTQGPVWAMQPEYQAFLTKSNAFMIVINKALEQVDQRIHQLLENLETKGA